MKKIFITIAVMLSSMSAIAGGLVTNTNLSVAYLRNPAREGAIDIDGIYFNPAGTAFLRNGIHLSVGLQTAFQQRNSEITFSPFALNKAHLGEQTHLYKGKAFAPVIPAIRLAYNWDRWNIQAAFNIVGGGGKCKFNDGLGMFESSLAGQAAQIYASTGQNIAYSLNSSVTGESYQYGIFLGSSYEIIKEHLSISLGVQMVYATNHYKGGLTNMQMWMGDDLSVPASAYLSGMAAMIADPTTKGTLEAVAAQVQNIPDVLLDCKQKGFGATPVIGIDYRLNEKFNISARYQFQTYMEMKNSADNSPAAQANASLANFQDNKKLRSDIPGYVMAGLQYSPIKQLHLSASYRYFDEKHAKRDMTGNKNEKNPGTHEACFGLEWDIFKYLTFSCGYQGGFYNLTKEEMSELDFQVNSHSVLAGFRINISDHWNIDLGYMHSFYDNRTVTTQPAEGVDYTVKYGRKNDVFGVAVNMCY